MKGKRLHVLFVTPWYPTQGYQYGGVFVREYAKAVQLHHDVTVLHCEAESGAGSGGRFWNLVREESDDLSEGIPTYRLRYRGFVCGRGGRLTLMWAVLRGVRELIRRNGPVDIIHAHVYTCGFYAAIAGKLYGIPVVVSEHWTGFPLRQLSRRDCFQAKIAFRLAAWVLPPSESLRRAIEQYGLHGNFRIVPDTVDTDLFTPHVRTRHGRERVRLLFVGSLIQRKGLSTLLEAMSQLQSQGHNLYLDVVGAGPEQEAYEGMTAGLGLADKVVFHGARSRREVAVFFQGADLFVLPSLCETFSVVTAEALASGVPALVTRCGGPEELVTEKSGMVVPPQDVQALAHALRTMSDHLEAYDRHEIARAAKERFGYEAVAAAFDDVYFQVRDSAQPRVAAVCGGGGIDRCYK